jgi:hypothetical protein
VPRPYEINFIVSGQRQWVKKDAPEKASIEVTLELAINRTGARAVVLATGLGVVIVLTFAAATTFIVGVLTDERTLAPSDLLAAAAVYFPESPRMNSRLAQSEFAGEEPDLSLAKSYALQAVNLSPWDYNYRLELANLEEATGNRTAAEGSLRRALALAPNNADVHWRLANLLVRAGKAEESVEEFRKAVTANGTLLGASFDLMWRVSGGRLDRLEAVAGEGFRPRLMLAQFLLSEGQVLGAARIFKALDRQQRLESREASGFLTTMADSGRRTAAHELWLDTVDPTAGPEVRSSLIWNGGFEADISSKYPQFDWNIRASQYARITIADDVVHSGTRSLRIDFTGLDTTRIDGEIKQLVAIKAGRHYRVECYARSDNLVTPSGPRLVVVDAKSMRDIATSNPVLAGSNDWVPLTCEFVAAEDCEAVLIQIKRLPKFSYDDPTRGTVWFDDFSVIESSYK